MRIDGPAGQERLAFRAQPNDRTAAVMKRATERLAKAARLAGMMALTPLARLNPLGSSFHCGGTFPMRENPKDGETDVLGRPAGLSPRPPDRRLGIPEHPRLDHHLLGDGQRPSHRDRGRVG